MTARHATAVLAAALLLGGCTDDDGESINPRIPPAAPTAPATGTP